MALFKVKINCVYLDLFAKTNIPKKIYKAGEFLELENVNVGEQPERIVEATEEEIAQFKAGKKVAAAPIDAPTQGNDKPVENAGNVDAASKEASKAKLLGDSTAPVENAGKGSKK